MKQLYSSLALLLIVAAVGGWIYFNERGPIAAQGSTVLLRAAPSSVNTVVLQRPDGRRVTLSRQGKDWRVKQDGVHPVAVPADGDAVKSLLDATQLIESAAVVKHADTNQLTEFGLAQPQSTLVVGEAKLEFGTKPSFDVNKVYARVTSNRTQSEAGGSQIALLPATLADFAARPFDAWRDKSVLRLKPIAVSKLQLRAPVVNANFERTAMGGENELDEWKVTQPVEARANAGTIVTLLQELMQTKAVKFLEDNPKDVARWGLDKPIVALELATADGARSLKIGRKVSGGRAAQNSFSNAVFVVPDTLLPVMNRPLRDWRDKTILKFTKSEVRTLRVKARGQSATFENDPNNRETPWKRTDQKATGSDPKTAGHNMLDISLALDSVKATDFIDTPGAPSTYGFDRPSLEIGLTSTEWRGEVVLQLAAKSGKVYARVGENGKFGVPVYVVAPSVLDAFGTALDSLFPKPDAKQKSKT
jgi:hypothetical protein